ncbi:MAG: methyltransferase [Caulobacter sp.]|nr:methyltransferase [Caulobacter sp.]
MSQLPAQWSRRTLLAASTSALVACRAKAPDGAPARKGPRTLEDAIAGDWRREPDRARDRYRHPLETLKFWGLAPGMTVVEYWPGAGWYTDIIGPFLTATGGRLYEANLQIDDPTAEPQAKAAVDGFARKMADKPDLYGAVELTRFGATSGPVAPAGSADLVLFARNIHNWMAAGIVDKAFKDAFAALKPGGVLGVEEHRADAGGLPDLLAKDGYVQQAYVVRLAKDAGFVLDGDSEINANPKDTKDHPFGVWTLPPTRLSAPRGEPARPDFDHTTYDAIGESDRMTLRFVRPR